MNLPDFGFGTQRAQRERREGSAGFSLIRPRRRHLDIWRDERQRDERGFALRYGIWFFFTTKHAKKAQRSGRDFGRVLQRSERGGFAGSAAVDGLRSLELSGLASRDTEGESKVYSLVGRC